MRWMAALTMQAIAPAPPELRRRALELGWVLDVPTSRPTVRGFQVGDACREYLLWEERGRRFPGAERAEALAEGSFEGQRVVELGCGIGCNLVSLNGAAREALGIEREFVRAQLAELMWELADLQVPRILVASAERTPLGQECCDTVVVLGALQYMPIRAVLAECERILAPGGRLVVVLPHFAGFLQRARGQFSSLSWRHRARDLFTVAGTLAYPWLGRGLPRPTDPVYPARQRLRRWMRAAGFEADERLTRALGHETCYVAHKVGRMVV